LQGLRGAFKGPRITIGGKKCFGKGEYRRTSRDVLRLFPPGQPIVHRQEKLLENGDERTYGRPLKSLFSSHAKKGLLKRVSSPVVGFSVWEERPTFSYRGKKRKRKTPLWTGKRKKTLSAIKGDGLQPSCTKRRRKLYFLQRGKKKIPSALYSCTKKRRRRQQKSLVQS